MMDLFDINGADKIIGRLLCQNDCEGYMAILTYLQARRLDNAQLLDSTNNTSEELFKTNGRTLMLNIIRADMFVMKEEYLKATVTPQG